MFHLLRRSSLSLKQDIEFAKRWCTHSDHVYSLLGLKFYYSASPWMTVLEPKSWFIKWSNWTVTRIICFGAKENFADKVFWEWLLSKEDGSSPLMIAFSKISWERFHIFFVPCSKMCSKLYRRQKRIPGLRVLSSMSIFVKPDRQFWFWNQK